MPKPPTLDDQPAVPAAKPAKDETTAEIAAIVRGKARAYSVTASRDRQATRLRSTIRALAAKHGITIAELAKRMGLPTPNVLYNLLGGRSRSFSSTTLRRLLHVFPDLTTDDLLGREPDSQGEQVQPPGSGGGDGAPTPWSALAPRITPGFADNLDDALGQLLLRATAFQTAGENLQLSVRRVREALKMLKKFR